MVKRNIITFTLLAALTLPGFLGLFVLKLQKKAIRSSVKSMVYQNLDSDQLTRLAFHKDCFPNLIWHHSDEFELNGQMYDVLKRVNTKDSVFYLCFWDQKESIINLKIDALALNLWHNSPFSSDYESSLIDFIQKCFLEDNIEFQLKVRRSHIVSNFGQYELEDVFYPLDSPPPRIYKS